MTKIEPTRLYKETLQAWVEGKRRCLHEGGTRSSKTWMVLLFLQTIAAISTSPMLISIVSESLPHLKIGCIRDFFHILGEDIDNNPFYNKTDHIYRRPEWKGMFEFFGADDERKARGPTRDILFINEGNNVIWEAARGLDIRTSRFTIVDWNPVGEFWAHENWKDLENTAYIHSTYLDAKEVLPPQVIEAIEDYRYKDPNWWNIYGLGLVGKIEGLVYPHFEQLDELPEGKVFYGLDFGFSNDPTVVVKNVMVGDKLYSDEVLYETGLTNDEIARKMDLAGVRKGFDVIWADSAEPKSIEEIARKGFNIQPAEKGRGSVEFGHQKVNQLYQYWTKNSVNCIKEQRNFRYVKRKDPKTGQEYISEDTTHQYSHGMSARRYAVSSHRQSMGGDIITVIQPGAKEPELASGIIVR